MPAQPPIAFFVFNRPEPTARVFEAIRRQRPDRLLIVGDGPRTERENEASVVQQVRDIVGRVDWPCEVATNFSSENLGCKQRVASGLKWIFEQVEEAIILEDDCLPSPDFFSFCGELLKRYRHDQRIAGVNGINTLPRSDASASYAFTNYFHCWGWATWRRVWKDYDVNMTRWPAFRQSNQLANVLDHVDEAIYWRGIFDAQHAGEIDSWDYAWQFMTLATGRLCISPAQNLISNIGFGADATHTSSQHDELSEQTVGRLAEIEHPEFITRNKHHDLQLFLHCHLRRRGLRRALWRLRNFAA